MLALLLAGLPVMLLAPAGAAAQAPRGPQPVVLAAAETAEVYDRIEVLGTLEANESVVLTANVGERIVELLFTEGERVSAGDLLVVLEQEEERARLEAANAILAERRAAFARTTRLEERQIAPTAQVDERRAALREAEAEVEIARAQLQDRSLLAPFDGRIGLRRVSPGTLVEPGDPIATLADIAQLKLTMDVPSRFLGQLRPGLRLRARTSAFPDRDFEGRLQVIDTQIDPVTRTVAVRALVPNPEELLRPGLLMTAELLSAPRQAVVVPEEALVPRDQRNFVYLAVPGEGGDPRAERREVRIGARRPGSVEIVAGVEAGAQVVIHGSLDLQPGAPLRVLGVADGETGVAEILARGRGEG